MWIIPVIILLALSFKLFGIGGAIVGVIIVSFLRWVIGLDRSPP